MMVTCCSSDSTPRRPLPAPRATPWCATLAALLAAACHSAAPAASAPPGPPPERTITAAGLDSLPHAAVTNAHLVCLSDGQSPCPIGLATANWLHGGRFATWEPNRQVQIWSPNQPDPQTLGEAGTDDSQYQSVVSVAASGSGFVILDAAHNHLLRFGANGRYQSLVPTPPTRMTFLTGYAGDVPLLQLIEPAAADSPAVFDVREIDAPGDTIGHSVLKLPLPWLRIRDGRTTAPLPLFPVLPAYTVAPDSDVIWSTGATLAVRRQSAAGSLRWSLTSDVTGPPVTPEEIAAARAQLGRAPTAAALASFDSSVARTAKVHSAVTALLLASDGRVLVAGAQTPARDSVDYLSLDATGRPMLRFALPRQSRVLLFAGDSLLVQRAGANLHPELRWLLIGSPPGVPLH